jgi:hypothetical protein
LKLFYRKFIYHTISHENKLYIEVVGLNEIANFKVHTFLL